MIFLPLWIASGLLIFLLQCWARNPGPCTCWASVLSLGDALALVTEFLVCTWVLCPSLSSFSVCQGSVSRKPVWNMWMILCKKRNMSFCLPSLLSGVHVDFSCWTTWMRATQYGWQRNKTNATMGSIDRLWTAHTWVVCYIRDGFYLVYSAVIWVLVGVYLCCGTW